MPIVSLACVGGGWECGSLFRSLEGCSPFPLSLHVLFLPPVCPASSQVPEPVRPFSAMTSILSTLPGARGGHSCVLTPAQPLLVSPPLTPRVVVSEPGIVPNTPQNSWLPVTAWIQPELGLASPGASCSPWSSPGLLSPLPHLHRGALCAPAPERHLGVPFKSHCCHAFLSPHLGIDFVLLCLLCEVFWG